MEEQLAQLLSATQSANVKQAEAQLLSLYNHPDFAIGLVSVASHESVPLEIRQAALLTLKTFVLAHWSPVLDEFKGQVLVSEENKVRIREALLRIATTGSHGPGERKIKAAASYVISKIASADFPEQWPDLLPQVMHLIPTGTEGQVHGALRVLDDLVDDSFNDEQFFTVARSLVKAVYDVAINENYPPTLRALAIKVFKGCFDTLEMVMEDHKQPVKAFADETLGPWIAFFLQVLKSRLPESPSEREDEDQDSPRAEAYRGFVALKLQSLKVLMRIRSLFPGILAPHSTDLFSAIWAELSLLQPTYYQMYIEEERQSRLEDTDGLPYTLDFLVLEDLDVMQACLRATAVKSELEQQLTTNPAWVTEVMKLAVSYAQITTEEEGLWDFDVNVFLSEETSVTANYTPRTACGDLVIKLGEWLTGPTIEGLLSHTRSLYSSTESWKAKEAALYILNQLLADFMDVDKQIGPDAANAFIDFIRFAMQQTQVFLRARGYLVAGSLTKSSGGALLHVATSFVEATLQAITNDKSEVVKVSCIRALQHYLEGVPAETMRPFQGAILSALNEFLQAHDIQELADYDDVMVTIIETLRDALLLDTTACITGPGLNLLFTVASHGASNFQVNGLATEAFDDIAATLSAQGGDAYMRLCEKVLPSLSSAFDVGNLTEENNLVNLAAELLSLLTQHGSTPLPPGFVQATMPKLNRLLLGSEDEELLKACTSAVKNIVSHDANQLFEWQDQAGRGGLEVILVIIDRLLSPAVEDNAAAEVGALAAELVERAGGERLGPYLPQLLRAVAIRLGTATQVQFIQSLTLVFARLSLLNAREVVDFLSGIEISRQSGLQAVLAKWLENSIHFAGYDEIRQNVLALAKLYDLQDPRLAQIQVKGDLIMPSDGRIMTRSRARDRRLQYFLRRFMDPMIAVSLEEAEALVDNADSPAQEPDQYTIIPASLKILKVLIVELAGSSHQVTSAQAAEIADDESDDGEWEDEGNVFEELGSALTKEQLMAFAEERPDGFSSRQRDDETQAFLAEWFRGIALRPDFAQEFQHLSEEERMKLQTMS